MKNLILLLPLSLLLTACPNAETTDGNTDSNLPESFEGLEISLHVDGGMMPVSEDIYICQDSAYWKLWRSSNETKIDWTPSESELNNLYNTLKDNNFDKIDSDCEEEVFDRGGTSIDIEIGGKNYELNNSQNCFIKEKWSNNYGAINSAIWDYTNEKIESQMIQTTIQPSDRLMSSGYLVQLNANNKVVYDHEGDAPKRKDIKVYPGINEFYIQLFYADSTNSYGSPVTFAWGEEYIDIPNNDYVWSLDLEDGQVFLEFLP